MDPKIKAIVEEGPNKPSLKDMDLELTDRILVEVESDPDLDAAFTRYNDYICAEILADQLSIRAGLTEGVENEINGKTLKINLIKKS